MRDGNQSIDADVRHRFVRGLNGVGVEFHPAGVRQFDEAAGRGGEALQIGGAQLEAFLFPLGGDRQPVDAAAFDDQARLELARREEQAMERRVAQAFDIRRTTGPRAREQAEKIFVGIADPETGLGREPIQLPQPLRGGLEARVVENFRLVAGTFARLVREPVVAVPEPHAVIALAFGEQPQAHGVIEQFENKLRLGRMRHAQFLPIQSVARLRAAQMREQTVAELAHRNGRAILPQFEHGSRRRIAQQVKRILRERERRLAGKEMDVRQRVHFAVGQFQLVRERQVATLAILQMRRKLRDLAMELQRLLVLG